MAVLNEHRFMFSYLLFWLLVNGVDGGIIEESMVNEDSNVTAVFFRWSRGFELNAAEIRCATDRSTEDPSNRYLRAYPEMKGECMTVTLELDLLMFASILFVDDVYFPRAPHDDDDDYNVSQRYRCDSNSSLFVYNPQTRRVHLVSNGHCLVVSQRSYHYIARSNYPPIRLLKSIDCKRAATDESTSALIWGSEFRLVRDNDSKSKLALRFISPTDGHEWTIVIRVTNLIIADKLQGRRDRLVEPILEIVHD